MYVFIAGAGVVGRRLTRSLVKAKHDVVVVDIDESVCETIYREYGAVSVNGDATDIDVLEEGDIEKADVAVALMRRDSDNLSFSLLADNFNVERIMARMRNSRYEDAYRAAGVDKLLNIADLYVDQLAMEIEQPQLRNVATLGEGEASIVIIKVPEDSQGANLSINEITKDERFPKECVISGIFREGEDFIFPRGSQMIRPGDRVFLAAGTGDIRKAADYFGVGGKSWFRR